MILPTPLPLTSDRLERHGLFLIEDGQSIFLWVGRDAVPQLVLDVFDVPSYAELRGGKVRSYLLRSWYFLAHPGSQTTLPVLDNPFSQRVNAVIQRTREMYRGVYHQHLYVVKEDGDPQLRLWALSCFIQDRGDVLPSYQQFISQLRDKVSHPLLFFDRIPRLTLLCGRSMEGEATKGHTLARVITYTPLVENEPQDGYLLSLTNSDYTVCA